MRIDADWIWTGAGDLVPGSLEIEDGKVAGIADPRPNADGARRLMLPGLVNAHVHLDLTWPPEDRKLSIPFTDWLFSVRDERIARGPEGLAKAAAGGVARLKADGTTLVVDYDSCDVSGPALADSGLKRVLLKEVIAFRPDDAPSVPALTAYLRGATSPLEKRGLAPHAPYTVHPEVLARLVEVAGRVGAPWSMHVGEQRFEEEFLRAKRGEYARFFKRAKVDIEAFPTRSEGAIVSLDHAGFLNDRPLLVHVNYLGGDPRGNAQRLAAAKASVVFCPRSHRFFGHTRHPLKTLLDAGVEVALGTDGMLSNGRLSILHEMKEVRRAFRDLPAERIVRMGTIAGHRALGRIFGNGKLVEGNAADVALFEIAEEPSDPLEALLSAPARCVGAWVNGEGTFNPAVA